MDYDFGIMLSDVIGDCVLTLDIGVRPNGNPIYRMAVFDGYRWKSTQYNTFKTALKTYKFVKQVI